MQGSAQSEAIGACSDLDTAGECYQRQLCIHRKYWRALSGCTCSKSCGLPLETFASLHVSAFLCIFGFYFSDDQNYAYVLNFFFILRLSCASSLL